MCCVAAAGDISRPVAETAWVVMAGPASAATLRSLWDEYRLVLTLDWSDAASRLAAGVNSPPDHPWLRSAPLADLGPASDVGDWATPPDFDLTALFVLEYVTTRVTGGIISGASGAAQNHHHSQQQLHKLNYKLYL